MDLFQYHLKLTFFGPYFGADFKVNKGSKDLFFAILFLVMGLVLSELIIPLPATELSTGKLKGRIPTQEKSTVLWE